MSAPTLSSYRTDVTTNFNAAIIMTADKIRRSVMLENLLAPKWEPTSPPRNAATMKGTAALNSKPLRVILPKIPAMEFTTINNADTADVFFGSAHRRRIMIGLRKIPPPTPTIPERNPITPPIGRAASVEGALGELSFSLDVNVKANRIAAANNAKARSKKYVLSAT